MSSKTLGCDPRCVRRHIRPAQKMLQLILVTLLLYAVNSSVILGQSPAPNIENSNKAADLRMRGNLRVNPSTLAVEFELSLANFPGRGGLNVPVTLKYSSKVWRIAYQSYTPSIQVTFDGQFKEGFTSLNAIYSDGWTSSIGVPVISTDEYAIRYSLAGMPLPETTDCNSTACYRIDRMFFRMPDNSVHELRSSDEPYSIGNGFGLPSPTPDDLYAVDGSGLRYQRSTQSLFLPDGSRYIVSDTNPAYIDRNGNKLTFTSDSQFNLRNNINISATDSLDRSIPAFTRPAPGDSSYSLPGFNGVPMNYTLKWRRLGDTGVMTNPAPLNYVSSFGCPPGAGQEPPVSGSPNLFNPDTAGRVFICDAELFNPVLLHQIVLPNGQAYKFTYNVYGELDKVVLPSGGYERYEYTTLPAISFMGPLYGQANRGVNKRYISSTGNVADEVTWTYAYTGTFPYGAGTPGYYSLTTTAPDGSQIERFLHTDSLLGGFGFDVDQGKAGMIYDERQWSAPDGNGTRQMLQRKLTEWTSTGTNASNQTAQQSARRNVRVAKEVAILLETGTSNALYKTTTHGYDLTYQFSVGATENSMSEYAWVVVSPSTAQTAPITSFVTPSQPMRTTETTNLFFDTSLSQSTRDAYRARHLVGLPSSTRVKDGAGNIVTQSSMHYDESSLVTIGNVSGWTDPQTPYRGNLTTRGNWLNTTGNELQMHYTFDQFGNVRSSTDAKGNQTTIGYSSNNAYPTTVTTPIPDPSGQSGSATAFTTIKTYDATTGLVTSAKDANDQITWMAYDDPLNRVTQITQPNGARIRYSYSDSPGDLYVKVLTDQDASRSVETRTYFDGLGRATRTFLYEGAAASSWIGKDTHYDAFGRVAKLSNPYRVIAPSGNYPIGCAECTTTVYDVLDRVISVITPDNAQVTTSYGGSTTGTLGTTTLVTDHAGKARKTVTDALGRLLEVYENPSGLNYKTTYTYDVLDNLRTVTQDTQPSRTFVYDSLSRLRSAANPESGTVNYQYDDNGNLTQKTDARGVVSNYTYDSLNRIKTIDYSDTTIAPDVSRFYDGASNGKGRPWYSFAGGNQTVGDNVEKVLFDNYDVLGRPGVLQQSFKTNGQWGSPYQTTRVYNLGGAVISQSYPSQHTVTYSYDDAGRLADKDSQNPAFSGNLGDSVPRTYSRGITYAPTGQMTQERFGTQIPIYNKLFYNSRQQLAEIMASTTPNDSSWNRGKIVNSYSLQCSGAGCNASDNNGNLRKQETYIPANDQVSSYTSWYQQFDYDDVNRLQRVHEYTGNTALDWQQEYLYDQWGNRRIDTNPAKTFGANINNKEFDREAATNRLYAPGDLQQPNNLRQIQYDAAGNQTKDVYTGYGTATFDAENRITAIQDSLGGTSTYTYNADSQRTRRKTNNQETWQIYGFDNELLAEYPARESANNPTKEYGYRNKQLLISADTGTASAPPAFGDDFNDNSLNSNSWSIYYPGISPFVSEQSQQLQIALSPNTAAYNGVYSNATYDLTNKMVQVESAQAVSQAGWCENFFEAERDANNYFMIQVGAGNMIFRSRVNGVNDQTVIPFDGTANRFWRLRHDQSANLIYFETSSSGAVWLTRKSVTPAFSLTALRFHLLAGAYGTGNSSPGTAKYDNFKLLPSTLTSSSLTVANASFEAPVVGAGNFQYGPNGSSWTFAGGAGITGMNSGFTGVPSAAPQGVQVAFLQNIGSISQSISGFQANTDYVITFSAIQRTNCCNSLGQDIGVYIDNTLIGAFHPGSSAYVEYSTVAFTTAAGPHTVKFAGLKTGYDETAFLDNIRINGSPRPGFGIQWLLADQLGTPRMVFDESGTLANVRRHDYLPFGEELTTQGLRGQIPSLGYGTGDGLRQHFTAKERDLEVNLDYFGARYYASTQGRFTSADPLQSSGRPLYPQSWNRYSYVVNRPLSLIDANGLDWGTATWYDDEQKTYVTDYHYFNGAVGRWNGHDYVPVNFGGDATRTLALSDGRTVVISNDAEVLDGHYMREVVNQPRVDENPVLPPSWMDHVPVLGNSRRFLFHYTTHNFEAALWDFSAMSLELGTAQVGASAGVAKSFATKGGEAIFFSGEGSAQLATEAALSEGGKVLTHTLGGKAISFITPRWSPKVWQEVAWGWGSKQFAKGASGEVRAFVGQTLRANNIWEHVEYPILRVNPFVRVVPR